MSDTKSDLCVAHLVRASNNMKAFADFLASYRAHPAGAEHELLIIFKGFADRASLAPYHALLADTPFRSFEVADEGFDIGPYRKVAAQFDYRHFCFLNSFSTILADGWLAKLRGAAEAPGVGIAGATGSWESQYSDHLRMWWRERSFRGNPRAFSENYAKLRAAIELRRQFAPFPNGHIRTNAFLIARARFLAMTVGDMREKGQAHAFESGRGGMTRQLAASGLRAVVVGRDGRAYDREDWPESRTFRSGEQQNLLVSDNQTRHYDEADAARRDILRQFAWRQTVRA